MNEFKAALGKFLALELDLDGLEAALVRDLAARPDASQEFLLYLEQLYQSGRITHQIYATLRRCVLAGPQAVVPDSSVSEAPKEDRTVFRRPDQQPGSTSTDDQRTRISQVSRPGTERPAGQTGSSQTGRSNVGGTTGGFHRTGTSGGFSASSQWTGGAGDADAQPIDVGSIIEGKYVLERLLGMGGMGAVYKARDLLAEEAQDRKPFVALKLLNEDFRRHRDSFQALQREASRTQKLNHPNVVAVRNFSRDRDTGHVYMTMELLEGEPLDRFIRRNGKGIDFKQALPIIRGLCDGLDYAHGQRIVHSDFKPGNAYLTDEGAVKIFDFGIARAAKRRGASAGDKTLFDAGTLGAITPSYASLEMLCGEDPDPQDDIYALACISYELLTGNHPFDRVPADKASEQKLVAKRVKGLSGRQWKGLLRGLAFSRAERTRTAGEFLRDISPLHIPKPVLFGAPLVLLLVLALGVVVVPQVLEAWQISRLETVLTEGSRESIEAALPEIEQMKPDTQSKLLPKGSPARNQLLAYFQSRVDEVFSTAGGRYEFDKARTQLDRLEKIGPLEGDAILARSALDQARDQVATTVGKEFQKRREAGCLIAGVSGCTGTLVDTFKVLQQLNPGDERLRDSSLPVPFAEAAEAAVAANDLRHADLLVADGLIIAPTDERLKGLQKRIAELREQEIVAELENRLRLRIAEWRTPADVEAARADFEALRERGQFGETVVFFQQRLYALLAPEVERLAADNQSREARALVDSLAQPLLMADDVGKLSAIISGAELPVGPTVEQQFVVALAAADQLLAKPDFTGTWAANLAGALRQLETIPLPSAQSEAAARRARAVGLFVGDARRRARLNDFAGAESLLEAADILLPGTPVVSDFRTELNRLKLVANETAIRDKRISDLKVAVEAAANDGDIDRLQKRLDELRKLVPTDAWLTDQAPEAMAKGLTIQATSAYSRKDYRLANEFIAKALLAKPTYKRATDLKKLIETETRSPEPVSAPVPVVDTGRSLSNIRRQFVDITRPLNGETIRVELARLQKADPALYKAREDELIGDLMLGINRLGRQDPDAANQRCQVAIGLFAGLECPEFPPLRAGGASPTQVVEGAGQVGSTDTQATEQSTKSSIPPAVQARSTEDSCAGVRGGNPRFTCRDTLVGDMRGPSLVVIPAGGPFSTPVAITRGEVSVRDYNQFCQSTGCVVLGGSATLPATDIPSSQVSAYALWLSEKSGHTYRLPTGAEWEYAANAAGGQPPVKSANCQLRQGDLLVKGQTMLPVDTGTANAWGLVNYRGNARELVRSGGGFQVRGGAYTDSFERCEISLSEPHGGEADKVTGFRLLREIG